MIRLMKMCLPLVLAPAMLFGQQTQPGTTQKTAQPSAKNLSSGTARAHKANHRRHRAARKGAKRAPYRPDYNENTVEVINGGSTRKVVFQNGQSATAPAKSSSRTVKTSVKSLKNAPQPMRVDVVNGSSTDTQYFYNNVQERATARNQPVVVGIQSSDTRQVGGNKHPVVTGVTASGTNDATAATNGGQPVTKSISPKPKRPEYQPEPH